MSGNSLADAFISVSPKLAKDGKKSIENELKAAGTSGGNGFADAFGAVSKKLVGVFAAVEVGRVLGEQFAAAFNGAAQREQLVGGVETLFGGDAAEIVQKNAAEAFKYAGISANTYMEQATSFSASLISSLKGDTVAAANVADMAMRDMSDNANKMGSSIESIQNAYQGFAKGNFTMLDNLKLGYGGTKTEMERLLADAQKISGVKYNLDNFADITQAIHVMQESMDIAGATFEESQTTVEGSINAMKAAFDNLLTGLGSGGDVGALFQQFVDSAGVAMSNIGPLIESILLAVIDMLPTLIPAMIQGAFSLFMGIVNAIPTVWPHITAALGSLIAQGVTFIASKTYEFLNAGQNLIQGLADGISAGADWVISKVQSICSSALDAIKSFFGIHSPSRVMRQMGNYIVEGMALGMDDGEDGLVKQANKINSNVLGTLGGTASYGAGMAKSGLGNTYIINGLEWTNDAKIENAMMTIFGGLQRLGAM